MTEVELQRRRGPGIRWRASAPGRTAREQLNMGPARRVRLAELVASLSLATDLGTGQPMEHALRTCWLSLSTAEALGTCPSELSTVYLRGPAAGPSVARPTPPRRPRQSAATRS